MGTARMKRALVLLCLGALLGCGSTSDGTGPSDEARSGLVGEWKLVALNVDLGNGSGSFQPVNGRIAETLTFQRDRRFIVQVSERAWHATRFWMYRVLDEQRIEMVYVSNTAEQPTSIWYYTDLTDSTVTLHYGCIEGCSGRYVRVR